MLISNSNDNISYRYQLIAQHNQEQLMDPSEEWVHYLQDHRELIKEHSTKIAVNETNMNLYRYRPRKFLAAAGTQEELELAFVVVNRIGDNMSFTEQNYEYVYVPEYNYIFDLRRMYVTLKYQEEDL